MYTSLVDTDTLKINIAYNEESKNKIITGYKQYIKLVINAILDTVTDEGVFDYIKDVFDSADLLDYIIIRELKNETYIILNIDSMVLKYMKLVNDYNEDNSGNLYGWDLNSLNKN